MNVIHRLRMQQGFSLIEVLIAVVVLSFGLLALTALQARLIQAGAESRARSVALSLAKDELERARSYSDLAAYRALTDAPSAAIDFDPDTAGVQGLGGVNFSRSMTVQRYAYNEDLNAFELVDDTVELDSADYPPNNEFKTISVSVTWTDASGASQTLVLQDAMGAIDPEDSGRLNTNRSNVIRKPEVIIRNPEGEAGVIPIAISDTTDSAATNPRPEVAGRNNNQRVVETRFDVLTYSALNNSTALAQSRVETSVVGCTCEKISPSGTGRGKRPTYWNGVRYVPPAEAPAAPEGRHVTLGNNDPPESALCTACCRDHHDPGGVAGAKFDPLRLAHQHYDPNDLTTPVGNNDRYKEACRLIRVDGIFRVAADAYNDHFNLLETASDGGIVAKLPYPSSASKTNYEAFVLNYLQDRFVTPSSSTTAAYNNPATGNAGTHGAILNTPTSIDIEARNDYRWLHSRGLYVDYLEPEAIAAINKAKTDCANRSPPCSSAEVRTAVLSRLPFTSINLSEISEWSPARDPDDTSNIVVTNQDFKLSLTEAEPVRGKVLSGGNPTNGATVVGTARILHSNSGLALLLDAIDPDETTRADPDNQTFRVVGSGTGTGGTFYIVYNGYTFSSSTADYPGVTSSPIVTCNYATQGGSKPNPFTCTTAALGVPRTLVFGNYNYEQPRKVDSTFQCTGPAGVKSRTLNNKDVNVCRNFQIVSPAGGVVSNDGLMSETTQLSFGTINQGDTITIGMQEQTPSQYAYTCTYTGDGNQNNDYTVQPAACP